MYKTITIPKEHIILLTTEIEKITDPSSMQGLYWLEIPINLLDSMQKEHLPECGPYVISLEIEKDGLIIEYLTRSHKVLHCDCIKKTSIEQKQFINEIIDNILLTQNITSLKVLEHED